MNRVHCRLAASLFLLATVCSLFGSSHLLAQDPNSLRRESESTGRTLAAPDANIVGLTAKQQDVADELPTADELKAERDLKSSSTEINEADKVRLLEVLDTAITHRGELAEVSSSIEKLTTERQEADSERQRLSGLLQDIGDPEGGDEVGVDQPVAQLRTLQQDLTTRLDDATRTLEQVNLEIERRSERLNQLPDLRSQTLKEIDNTANQLAALPPPDSATQVQNAQRTMLQIRRALRQQESQWMQLESQVYPETRDVWLMRQDVSEAMVSQLQNQLNEVRQAVGQAETQEAEQKAESARHQAERLPEPLRSAAIKNAELAEENAGIVSRLDEIGNALSSVTADLRAKTTQYQETRKQAEAAEFSPAIGLLLRAQKSELPSTARLYERARQRRQEVADVNYKILNWENERRKIADVDQAITTETVDINWSQVQNNQQVREELKRLLTERAQLYRELIENARTQLNQVARLNAAESDLVDQIQRQAQFISEHILWVRSTTPITWELLTSVPSGLSSLLDPGRWLAVVQTLWNDFENYPVIPALFVLIWLWLIVARRRVKKRLTELGQQAIRPTTRSFLPTAQSLLLTLSLAAPWPLLLWALGWRLISNSPMDGFEQIVGNVLIWLAALEFTIEFIRQMFRTDGVAAKHFDWEPRAVSALRRLFSTVRTTVLPVAALVLLTDFLGDQLTTATAGRFALIAGLLIISWALYRAIRPNGAIISELRQMVRLPAYTIWRWLLVLTPLALAAASVTGYHYAAVRLSERFLFTLLLVIVLVVLRSILNRWLLVSYRHAAMQQAEERRREAQTATDSGQTTADERAVAEEQNELQLQDVNQQSRSLVNLVIIIAGVTGLVVAWNDAFSALGILNRYHLWLSTLKTTAVEPVWVTLGDVFIAIAIIAVVVLICRNVTGLLNMVVPQKATSDQGIRFAVAALTQYVLMIVAVIFAFRQIGIGWSSVQWLAAAITVGLGFGLQEIFANFVSGIILLFERPVRIGDTVTINNVTGTVSRIRIRATTIVDWDNKELIVPNREFVTGNLVNWTLTNQRLRIVLNVGIAYGSDTRLATELLYRVAREHPGVLTDPEPVVVFREFGDNSLNFELRVHVFGIQATFRLRHELNTAIDTLFREHNIEIAFPQRDLHVRSISAQAIEGLRKRD